MKTQNVNDVEAVTDVKISFNVCEEHTKNVGALSMKNENSNINHLNAVSSTYYKKYTTDDEIREFKLIMHGDLDEKLKEIIEYYKKSENLSDNEIVNVVLRFGLVRCYKMNYISVKSYLFKIAELERFVDIYSDMIDIIDDKKHLINQSKLNIHENFWIKTEIFDVNREKIFNVSMPDIEDFSLVSLKIAGELLEYVEDSLSVYRQKFGWNTEQSIERMVRVGINRVYDTLIECCNTDELNENNIFSYDHE
jgi:hypothetical protein